MIEDEDEELEEILKRKKEMLLKKKENLANLKKADSSKQKGEIAGNAMEIVDGYLSPSAKRYLYEKIDDESRPRVLESIFFLIKYGLVEKPLDVEAVAFISRRVLGTDYKIFVDEKGEYKEI